MSDFEKFQKFFQEYGIDIKLSQFRRSYSDSTDGLKQYYMDGDTVDIDSIEGSVWCFDKDGKFIKVVEGS